MNDAIKSSIILTMTDSLELVELGAAVRILARIIEKKGAIPLRNAHLVAGVTKEEWLAMQDAVLACFSHSESEIALAQPFLKIPSIAQEAQKVRKGKTAPLFVPQPQDHKPEALPAYLAKRPNAVTIKQAAYDSGLRLFMGNGMTEKMARSILANLLASYPAGDVAGAIDAAGQQEGLTDPHSWIVAQLRQKARGARIRVRPTAETQTKTVGAQTLSHAMTDKTIAAIRERNLQLQGNRLGSSGLGLSQDTPTLNRTPNDVTPEQRAILLKPTGTPEE